MKGNEIEKFVIETQSGNGEYSLVSFRPKRSGVEKSIIETKSGNGKFCLLADLSTSSRGHNSLSFRAGHGVNKKINSTHGPLKTRYGKLAFTLVELIVVIVILGVLATVGFLAFADYPKQARDVVRISNLKEIEKAIEFYKIRDGDYPIPTNYTTGTIDGFSGTWYIGSFGEDLANQIQEITKPPLDPKTKTGYYYALREDKMNYRIIADLEETGKKYIVANMIKTHFTPPTIIGNDTIGRSYSNNSYATTCNEYKNPTNTNYSYSGSIGDGVYLIKPNTNPAFRVYCDMTTDGGGWTRIIKDHTTTLADLSKFGDTSDIASTFYSNSNYGVGWGTNDLPNLDGDITTDEPWINHRLFSVNIPYREVKIKFSGFHNNPVDGLGYLGIYYINFHSVPSSSLGSYHILSFNDPWNGSASGQSLYILQNTIYFQQPNDEINRQETINTGGIRNILSINMKGYQSHAPYTKRYIGYLYVR